MKKNSVRRGFTIVELLIVIVVIGILAAIAIVSYTGITNRATVASLQSDLTNANSLIRMDYTSNGTFPGSLAQANNGKGITASQPLDASIYVPDNTSNPSSFCLEYRKGTNTYAVDSNSQPAKAVCLNNLVTNSDFSDGINGWVIAGFNYSIANNTITLTSTSTTPRWEAVGPSNSSSPGDIMYFTVETLIAPATYTYLAWVVRFPGVELGDTSTPSGPSASGAWVRYSLVATSTSASAGVTSFGQYLHSSTLGLVHQLRRPLMINLTATFGAGNEPTQAQMDALMNNYPNNWFKLVAKANL